MLENLFMASPLTVTGIGHSSAFLLIEHGKHIHEGHGRLFIPL